MVLFPPRCPVDDRERAWIAENIAWLRAQFGDAPLSAPVILPTSDYFPPPFSGSDQDIRSLVGRVARYMGVQAGYMTEQMLGFALACYAMLRAEPDPPWVRYLDTNPRAYMKHGIKYLRRHTQD